MEIIKFLKHPRVYIQNKANKIAENKIKQLNFISITETNDEDIFIAGFPKSGNTWMQNLVSSILLETATQRLTPRLVNEIVPDVHAKQYYKRIFPVMFFKTHNLPQQQYKRVIHLVRDGRDAMVSYYHMETKKDKNYPYNLQDMLNGKGVFPDKWYVHTRLWLNNPFNAEILTIRYEDLLIKPIKELEKICKFANIHIDDSLLKDIVEANNINNLRQRFVEFGTENENVYKDNHVSSFYRKGIIGDFKNEMTEKMIKEFNEEAFEELKHFNYL